MAEIVAVHGILNEFLGSESLEKDWAPAIRDGLRLAEHRGRPSVCCAFYGDLFRPKATKASGPPLLNADDISPGTEEALLAAWWASASVAEPSLVTPPDSETKVSYPGGTQRAVKALMKSAFFRGFAGRHGQRALIFGLRKVREYLENERIREEAQARFRECIGEETRAVVAHSLGSIVAYEVLASWNSKNSLTFVSLGSPLGMSPIVFDRLRPAPENGFGKLPNVGCSSANTLI